MRLRRILLGAGLIGIVGCSQDAPPTERVEVDLSNLDVSGVEAGPLQTLPTHWTGDGNIGNGDGPVTDEALLTGNSDPTEWVLYGGNYSNHRHSAVTAITPENVAGLKVAWAFPTGTLGQFETSPVVYDGIMYVTSSYNRLFALNPTNGELYWRYDHVYPQDLRICCGPVNRGVGISGDLVLMATLDAQLIAFNRLTGAIQWQTEIAPYTDGYSATSAPMIVKDMAIIGIAGGEFGVRGFFDAYDVNTGELRWRHYTVPSEGEPGVETWAGDSWKSGGAPAWTSGAYDPDTDTLYWTTGNPSPDWNGDLRAGDNLFSNSILALKPDTGEQIWYFQFTPHDVWDYDGNTQIFLVDIRTESGLKKAIVQPNRNGYFYILDRTDGTFLGAEPYVEEVNWATIDEIGRPVVDEQATPVEDPTYRVCPSNLGGMNGAWTGALNPDLGLVYVPVVEACQRYQKGIVAFVKGQPFMGGQPLTDDVTSGRAHGHLSAVDMHTGKIRWRYMDANPMMGGVVSTAGGVVFTGNQKGYAIALDAANGSELWNFKMGGGVRSQPIVFEAEGKSYMAIGAGNWNTFAAFSGGPVDIPEGGHLFVFTLPD